MTKLKEYNRVRFADLAAAKIVSELNVAASVATKDDKFIACRADEVPEGWSVVNTVEPTRPSGSVIPLKYKARYGKEQNCGDDIAETLSASTTSTDERGHEYTDEGKLATVALQNGVDMGRWSHLNVGMKRMNLGNVLRGKAKRGEFVAIGDHKWNDQKVAATA